MEEKRVRKKSKRLSESSSLFEEEEPPRKRTKRLKSTADNQPKEKRPTRKPQPNTKGLIVSLDYTNNEQLTLGGVPLSQLTPLSVSIGRARGQRSSRSTSISSSHGNGGHDAGTEPRFKNPKFCFSYLVGNKKKTWKNFKQIMTAEKSLPWRPDEPRYSSLDAPPLLKPARKYSDISGLLAKYTDPLTGLYYSTADEFQLIRTLPSDVVQSYLALRGKMTIS